MTTATASTVLDYAREHRDRFVRLTRALVEAESPSAHPETHDEIRRVLKLALAEVGYRIREIGRGDGPRHLLARHHAAHVAASNLLHLDETLSQPSVCGQHARPVSPPYSTIQLSLW